MTISSSQSSTTLAGNGATTAFAFGFVAGQASNIVVTFTNAAGTAAVLPSTAYSIALNAPPSGAIWGVGGTVTYPLTGSPIAAGTYLTIARSVPLTQLTSISNQGSFYPQAVEAALDTLCMEIQEVDQAAVRALQWNPADQGPFNPIPPQVTLPSTVLGFNASSQPVAIPLTGLVSPYTNVLPSATEYDVTGFGAVGDGVTDDTTAIQNAINFAAIAGGTVLFRPLSYVITRTLNIGNGTISAVSSTSPVRLRGAGDGWLFAQFFAGYSSAGIGTRILWRGSAGGTMISVNGPLQGWGVSNMALIGNASNGDFAGVAGYGLMVISAMNGKCDDLEITGCQQTCLYSQTVVTCAAGFPDSFCNIYNSLRIGLGWTANSKGIVLTTGGAGNTDYNIFTNLMCVLPTTITGGTNAYGVYLQACDSCVFINPHFFNGAVTGCAFAFDYSVNASWPAGCQIINPDWGGLTGPIQQVGTPNSAAAPNLINGINECNGGIVPLNFPNLSTISSVTNRQTLLAQTGSIASFVLQYVFRAAIYRVNWYMVMTGGTGTAGTVTAYFSWMDGFGTRTQSGQINSSVGSYASGSFIAYPTGNSSILASSVSAITGGTPQYEIFYAVERIS